MTVHIRHMALPQEMDPGRGRSSRFSSPLGGPSGPRSSGSMRRSMNRRHLLRASNRRRSIQDAWKVKRTRRAGAQRFIKAPMASNICV